MERKNIKTFDEHLTQRYGKVGSKKRAEFEIKAKSFAIGESLKDLRLKSNLTQDELAKKIGAKKSYISRIENGKTDIQLSTLYKIFEVGLGKTIHLTIS